MSQPETPANVDQSEYWNSAPGRKWLRHEQMLDAILAGVDDLLLARADPRPGERVVEIGCGTGATTRALAARVGASGSVLAVDISRPLLARARERTEDLPQVSTLLGDAQVHPFPPGGADLAASRFGVMFFEHPVAAFRNIGGALRGGGRLCIVCWAAAEANPWFRIPRDAAIERLGRPAPQPPTAPGPLAFADRGHVRRLLAEAGLVGIEDATESVDLVWKGGLEPLVELATSLGPVARIMRERGGTADDEASIREKVAEGLAGFRGPDEFRIPASLTVYAARKS